MTSAGDPGFSFTSFALSQHFLGVTLSNTTHSQILVFNMDELYPRQVDDIIVDETSKWKNYLMMSTDNYLEKGFFFFFFDTEANMLNLTEYVGYTLKIKPLENLPSDAYHHEWKIVMEVYHDFMIMKEQLNISVIIRNFTDPSAVYKSTFKLSVDSHYVNLNLTQLAIGPLQRYYIKSQVSQSPGYPL